MLPQEGWFTLAGIKDVYTVRNCRARHGGPHDKELADIDSLLCGRGSGASAPAAG